MRNSFSFTLAAASLTGFASNVTGAAFALSTLTTSDGLAHQVTVRNDSATNHSAKTLVIVGRDANGYQITETIAAPGTSATVTSTKYFRDLISVTPSATIGADTFDIGWAAAAHGPWLELDVNRRPFDATVGIKVGGTINYDLQFTFDVGPTEDTVPYTSTATVNETTSQYEVMTAPVSAVRIDVNSHTSGTFVFEVMQ
jgi:hypothetical protein